MKNRYRHIILAATLILALVVGFAAIVNAQSIPQGIDDDAFYSFDQPISNITEYDPDKMPFFFGNNITTSLDMDTTPMFFGNQVAITGNYANDVVVFANTVTVDANIEGNLYMFCSSATISGTVGGDVFNASAVCHQTPSSAVGANLIAFAQDVQVLGNVQNNAYLMCEIARISGSVGRNIQGAIDQLTVEDSAKVGGFIKYQSDSDPVLAGNAASIPLTRIPLAIHQESAGEKAKGIIMPALGLGVAALLIYLLFAGCAPCAAQKLGENLKSRFAAAFGLGCAVLIGMPILSIFALLISARLGFALLLLYGFLIAASMFITLIAILMAVIANKNWPAFKRLLAIALMGLAAGLLLEVPVLGGILGFLILVMGLGLPICLMLKPRKRFGLPGEGEQAGPQTSKGETPA